MKQISTVCKTPIIMQCHVLTAFFEADMANAKIIEVGTPKMMDTTNIIPNSGMMKKQTYGCFRKVAREKRLTPRLIAA